MTSSTDEAGPLGNTGATAALKYFELKPGKVVSTATLKALLPDVKTALFFAKAYKLGPVQLGVLLHEVFHTSLLKVLIGQADSHSTELQDYLIDVAPPEVKQEVAAQTYTEQDVPDSELLADMWEQINVDIAKSIQDVADKLAGVLDRLPSKYGQMTFSHLRKLNVQRASIGKFGAQVQHVHTAPRLVILDVSGSMTEHTIRSIVDEVVALAYQANADLAIVSDTTTWWGAGTFSTHDVLKAAEFCGTRYETLRDVLNQDWETVITIADHDSSPAAQQLIARDCTGRIGQVLDISLVNKTTYLAVCVGQLAQKVKPLLIGTSPYPISN